MTTEPCCPRGSHVGLPGGVAHDLRRGQLPWPWRASRAILDDFEAWEEAGVELLPPRVEHDEAAPLGAWLREKARAVETRDAESARLMRAAADRVLGPHQAPIS